MVSFQTLLVQPGIFCLYYKGCSKTIGVVLFFFQMKPLSVFLKWFHFKLCLYLFVWLNILEIQLQKHWFYNGCITNSSKSIAFTSNTNLRTTQKILVKCTDIKSVQKLSQTQQKVMKSRQVPEALKMITTCLLNIKWNMLIWHLNEKGPEQNKAVFLVCVWNETFQL